MRIYTTTGDSGETGLFAGGRVRKDDPRIEALGTLDELNAALGVVRADELPGELDNLIARVQDELLELGAQVGAQQKGDGGLLPERPVGCFAQKTPVPFLTPSRVTALEASIDRLDAALPPLKAFVLPGGSPVAAQLHMARCVCRRAERRIVSLAADVAISTPIIAYLNRLGDLLFVAARFVNHAAGVEETVWESS